MTSVRRQGGGSLLIVLIALAIVAYLARDALLSAFASITRTPTVSGEARLPPGARPATDASAAVPTFESPVERARGVEGVVRAQQEKIGRQIDAPR